MGNSTSHSNKIDNTVLWKSLIHYVFLTTGTVILEFDALNYKYRLYPKEHLKSMIDYCENTFYYEIDDPIGFGITDAKIHGKDLLITAKIIADIPLTSVSNVYQQMYNRYNGHNSGKNSSNLWTKVLPYHIKGPGKIAISNDQLLTTNFEVQFYDYDFFSTVKYTDGTFHLGEPVTLKSTIKHAV